MAVCFFLFLKQKTAYEMRISDWSSDVCSSDLIARLQHRGVGIERRFAQQRRELGGARAGVADDDPRWMEIVVERLALAQELGRKDDRIAAGLGAHPLGEADRHRRLEIGRAHV